MTDYSKGRKPGRPFRGGFASAGHLLKDRIARAGESRGFAVARLLTRWPEVVGEDVARLCTPVKVGYARKGGLGATLTLRVVAAAGPIVQAQSEVIRRQVNACYGYNAIARIALTQTGHGFAEPQADFGHAPKAEPQPSAEIDALTADVTDPELRAALASLGARVETRHKKG